MPKNSGGKYCTVPCPLCNGKNKMTRGARSCWECRYKSFKNAYRKCTNCGIELNDDNWVDSAKYNQWNICRECFDKRARENYKTRRVWYRKKHQRLKRTVIEHYGGKCACCGVEELIFLNIDHVNNDGNIHRHILSGDKGIRHTGQSMYRWLINNDFPEGFQVLCFNCNFAKSQGGCPHQGTPKAYEDVTIVEIDHKKYVCNKCGRIFDHHSGLANHTRYKHPQALEYGEELPHEIERQRAQ